MNNIRSLLLMIVCFGLIACTEIPVEEISTYTLTDSLINEYVSLEQIVDNRDESDLITYTSEISDSVITYNRGEVELTSDTYRILLNDRDLNELFSFSQEQLENLYGELEGQGYFAGGEYLKFEDIVFFFDDDMTVIGFNTKNHVINGFNINQNKQLLNTYFGEIDSEGWADEDDELLVGYYRVTYLYNNHYLHFAFKDEYSEAEYLYIFRNL